MIIEKERARERERESHENISLYLTRNSRVTISVYCRAEKYFSQLKEQYAVFKKKADIKGYLLVCFAFFPPKQEKKYPLSSHAPREPVRFLDRST